MAKGINIKKVTKSTLKDLQSMSDSIERTLPSAVLSVANDALNVAKEAILSTPHTQKYGDTLVNEVGIKSDNANRGRRTGNTAYIIAPYRKDTVEMRRQMYYLEHGAGVLGSDAYWYYPTVHGIIDKNPNKVVSKTKDARRHRIKNEKGEPLTVNGKKYTDRRWLGFTNYSAPAHYMKAASEYLYFNLRPSLMGSVRLAINRKSPYRLKEKYYTEEGKPNYDI